MSDVQPGEIVVDAAGNVTIGAPTAVSAASAPQPFGDQETEDE